MQFTNEETAKIPYFGARIFALIVKLFLFSD